MVTVVFNHVHAATNQNVIFATGLCSCHAGFTGLTCHDTCLDGFFGIDCVSTCHCASPGTRSCDNVDGSCDCYETWIGVLCDIESQFSTQ